MRLAEYALLSVPVLILIAWLYGIRGLSVRGVIAFAFLIAMMGGMLYWAGADRMFNGRYVPAHLDGGHVVPGSRS
jgi:NADH:ubiquinone oxidoreductase subunit 3 (subunit A)